MNDFALQMIHLPDQPPIAVSALPTDCTYLVVTPTVAVAKQSGQLEFGPGVSLTHTITGRAVTTSTSTAALRALAAQLVEFDWSFTDANHFTLAENAEMRDVVARRIRDWQSADAYTGAAHYPDDDEATIAAREHEPATTLLREHLDWWIKHSEARYRNLSSIDDNPEAWHANIGMSCEGFGLIYLLAVLQRVAPDAADIAARHLVIQYDAGDSLGEWIYEWNSEITEGRPLTLHGIPEADPLKGFAGE
ncbi:hypothetical protein [Mycolicibacterium palauense]|uniref:hypothetical protein n=1 Tax=Mycolicibacterium palauense TaxID=2034511 RepID=UPI000BFEEA0A|nr:hypothetical protein [Mycolicibacterium palauense]